MLHYSNGDVDILNHDVARAVIELTNYGRNLIYENASGDFNDISRAILEYTTELTAPHKALLDSIGIDNAVQLAVVVLQAEDILMKKISSISSSVEAIQYDPAENEDKNKEWDYDDAYTVALLCWKKRISIKDLAVHLNISDNAIREIKKSDEYLQAIENIILNVPNYRCAGDTPTHEEIYIWITDFPKKPMHAAFSKIMGITESNSEQLINGILDKIDFKGYEEENE